MQDRHLVPLGHVLGSLITSAVIGLLLACLVI